MKLSLTKYPNDLNYLPTWSEELFETWMRYNNIYIGQAIQDFSLRYNSAYHFYDLVLFPVKGKYPTDHWQKVINFFVADGYKTWEDKGYWRWDTIDEKKVMTKGIRIWIYAKNG